MRYLKILLVALTLGCATTPVTPPVKSILQVTPVPKTEIRAVLVPEEPSPASYLQAAFRTHELDMWKESIELFSKTIETDGLNDAGRALAYWHIAFSYEKLGNKSGAAESYFFFTLVAHDILNPTNWKHEPIARNEIFIESFRLQEKLDYAIKFLNKLWKLRTE